VIPSSIILFDANSTDLHLFKEKKTVIHPRSVPLCMYLCCSRPFLIVELHTLKLFLFFGNKSPFNAQYGTVYYRENARYSNCAESMYGTVTVQRECTVTVQRECTVQ
jgi:hypothetical protein